MWKVAAALTIAIAMITVSSVVDTISLYIGGLVASYLMWVLGLVTVNDARNSVDLSVMVSGYDSIRFDCRKPSISVVSSSDRLTERFLRFR